MENDFLSHEMYSSSWLAVGVTTNLGNNFPWVQSELWIICWVSV